MSTKQASVAIHLDRVSKRFRLGTANDCGRLTEAVASGILGLIRGSRNSKVQASESFTGSQASDSGRVRDGWFWALENIDLTINAGEVVGIVGRNGAGKSTLLKILSRIVSPTTGRVGIRGRVGSLLEVGTGFHHELTGRENIFLNGAILGLRRAEIRRKFDEIVAFADIGPFLDTPVKRYSSGMAVRLAFAVAAHLEPDVLVIDEILSVGDQAFQRKCLGKATEMGAQGRTILMVSHNLSSVANLCSRAILLEGGRMVDDGRPDAIIDRYLAASRGTDGRVEWIDETSAPHNETLRLRSVAVSGTVSDTPNPEVDIDGETSILVEYQVKRPGTPVCVQIHVKDETGVFVLSSANAPSMNLTPDQWFCKPHDVGTYRSECKLPPNFLNDTRYFVSVHIGPEIGKPTLRADSILSLVVHDTGAMRKEYTGPWFGPVVRPRLDWKTTKLS